MYESYCETYGWQQADTFSARPGYSEHQTGLTIDCNTIDDAFGQTEEAVWLADHCADYGFIIRFPDGKEDITGYQYEPWHIRYVAWTSPGRSCPRDFVWRNTSRGLRLCRRMGTLRGHTNGNSQCKN